MLFYQNRHRRKSILSVVFWLDLSMKTDAPADKHQIHEVFVSSQMTELETLRILLDASWIASNLVFRGLYAGHLSRTIWIPRYDMPGSLSIFDFSQDIANISSCFFKSTLTFNPLPALKNGSFFGAILTFSPVLGFQPVDRVARRPGISRRKTQQLSECHLQIGV